MEPEALIAEIARYSIFEGALPSTRPEDVIHLAAKVRAAAGGKGIEIGVEKFLWFHEKEALRLFGPNPAGAATAIRSVIFNYIMPRAGNAPLEGIAAQLAKMEITPETKLDLPLILKNAIKPPKPEKPEKPEKGAKKK